MQISDENLHHVIELMDEIFGSKNRCAIIAFKKTGFASDETVSTTHDFLVWYCRSLEIRKFHKVFGERELTPEELGFYDQIELADGSRRALTSEEKNLGPRVRELGRPFARNPLVSPGWQDSLGFAVEFGGQFFKPPSHGHWKTSNIGVERLRQARRLAIKGNTLRFIPYFDDFALQPLGTVWSDTGTGGFVGDQRLYVVQTDTRVVARCVLMVTDPGDPVFDPTCGSGTTAYIAEQWGRRWITCDTSRVATTLAKQRLSTAVYTYYELAHSEEGIGSGFRYRKIPHITLKSIAKNAAIHEGMIREQIDAALIDDAEPETLYDQPYIDKNRARVSGPFTVEAVPAPTVQSLDDIEMGDSEAQQISGKDQQSLADFRHGATLLLDASVTRSGPTLRHTEWRDELLKTGLRGKGGNHIDFSRVEPLAGTRWLHADAETKGVKPERVVISFGPEHSLLDPRQVESAWQEARTLIPRPAMIVFAAFEFDPQAAKEIDDLTKEKTGMTFLSAQMNADLLTADLKKKRASNQGFWLVGRPDVDLRRIAKGDHKGKWEVEVKGFDYYNTRTGTIDSGDVSKIAMWLLDTDYDERSLYPRQVFFPIADADGGWARLAKNLKAEIDPHLVEAYRGTVSLPFEPGNMWQLR
ncbi:MAG: DNA methyltransferase [Terracidiphilus sp.]